MVHRTPRIGEIIKCISISHSANYQIGQKYRVASVNPTNQTMVCEDLETRLRGNNLYWVDAEFHNPTSQELHAEIIQLQNKIEDIQSKIDFLKENELTEFNEKDYLIHRAVLAAERMPTQVDKINVIGNLIDEFCLN